MDNKGEQVLIKSELCLVTRAFARTAGLHHQTVRNWYRSGRLRFYRVNGAYYIPSTELARVCPISEVRKGRLNDAPKNPQGWDEFL